MRRPTRRTLIKGIAAGGASLGFAAPVGATSPTHCTLNWGAALSQRQGHGRPAVDVTQTVLNDVDSGFHGYWATTDYHRLLRAWPMDEGSYRVVASYNGRFHGVEGQRSPGQAGGAPLSGDERGSLHGGYAGTVDGSLLDDLDWPTRGFVGTYDYAGDVETGQRENAVDWTTVYFGEHRDFSFDWWGWIYEGGRCGTWVNAGGNEQGGPGNCGDVICG